MIQRPQKTLKLDHWLNKCSSSMNEPTFLLTLETIYLAHMYHRIVCYLEKVTNFHMRIIDPSPMNFFCGVSEIPCRNGTIVKIYNIGISI